MGNAEIVHKCSIVGLGGAVSIIGIDQIETYLGIALVGVQLALVVAGLIYKLVKYLKSKKTNEALQLIEETSTQVQDLKNELAELKKRRGING